MSNTFSVYWCIKTSTHQTLHTTNKNREHDLILMALLSTLSAGPATSHEALNNKWLQYVPHGSYPSLGPWWCQYYHEHALIPHGKHVIDKSSRYAWLDRRFHLRFNNGFEFWKFCKLIKRFLDLTTTIELNTLRWWDLHGIRFSWFMPEES